MTNWAVEISTTTRGESSIDENAIDDFVSILDSHAATAAYGRTSFNSRFCIDAVEDPVEATREAVRVFADAVHRAGLATWPVVKIELEEWDQWSLEQSH